MAHSLRGKDKENFIITVCDLNIYLGCICALTCEKNATVEEYIWKTLNNYFQPRKIKFYDKSSGIWKENIKKLNSKDITYYLLACNVMGNMKAIKWYIYNHEVDYVVQCRCGCFACRFTAFLQHIVDSRNIFFEFLAAVTNRLQRFLHDIVEEAFHFHIA